MSDRGKFGGIVVCVLVVVVLLIVVPLYISQCVVGDSNSVTITVKQLTLRSKPTDTNIFGIDWFGKPKDEIAVYVWSGICMATSQYREIGEGQTIVLGHTLNSFFTFPLSFRLEESDGGLEGRNDHSDTYSISGTEMKRMRELLADDTDKIQLNYYMKVKGGDIFSENKIFGFIAKNLCISAIDFALGPLGKLAKSSSKAMLAVKVLGKKGGFAQHLGSKDVAKLYERIGDAYSGGKVNKKAIFKAVGAYQMKVGLKEAVKQPLKDKLSDYATGLVLDQTRLDEELHAIYDELLRDGHQTAGTEEEYEEVDGIVDKWGSLMAEVTDSMEFCLSDIKPRSPDATYYLEMEATKD